MTFSHSLYKPDGLFLNRLARAISDSVSRLRPQQSADGLWRSVYEGGPVHISTGLIATTLLDARPEHFKVEAKLVSQLIQAQDAGGGVAPYSGGPVSRACTRMVQLALELFLEHHRFELAADPALRVAISECLHRARRFLSMSEAVEDGLFLTQLSDLLWDSVAPERSRTLLPIPFTAKATEWLMNSPWSGGMRERLSPFFCDAAPAIGILFEKAAQRSPWLRWTGRSESALRTLEQDILKTQCKSGGWLWSVFGTVLNLLALRAMGRGRDDLAVRRGLDFIHRLRMEDTQGCLRQSWCNAELWDSSVSASVLLLCDADDFHTQALVEHLLREQVADGLWAFGAGALDGDNDSSTAVVAFLSRVLHRLPAPLARETEAALRRSIGTLLCGQQQDGGWGYGPEPHEAPYSFGARSPLGLETTVIDASTPDVTGRMLGALVAAQNAGVLDEGLQQQMAFAWRRAVRYLQASQTPCGSWVGRWTAGYLSSPLFILPALRAGGEDMKALWIRRTLAFFRGTQNPDGGWGESTEADKDPSWAGKGVSSPIQTAYALAAMTACSDAQAVERDPRILAGVNYLLKQQERGTWENRRALYTVAFRDDYFDAELLTHTQVLNTLRYVQLAFHLGPEKATRIYICGKHDV